MKAIYTISAIVVGSLLSLQTQAQDAKRDWHHADPSHGKVYGVADDRAYAELLKGRAHKTVIVAVIDGGTDVNHEDLKANIWHNEKEVNGKPGIDDDGNGYIDDFYGWNFIGGKQANITTDNLELTRLVRAGNTRFSNADTNTMDAETKTAYHDYIDMKNQLERDQKKFTNYRDRLNNLQSGIDQMRKQVGKDSCSIKELKAFQTEDKMLNGVKKYLIVKAYMTKGHQVNFTEFKNMLAESQSEINKRVEYQYNVSFDPRSIVGDNYNDIHERYYGNNAVDTPNADHGTHVAGIIGAVRDNGIGINGIADDVRIMVLRVVPDGDERDKDIANAIRYAADNGAKLINMSFGKAYSPNKAIIDEAVKYAASKDVLLIHAAGNDAKNTDIAHNYPTSTFTNSTERAANWIEVGANSSKKKKKLTASFSNYGKGNVDVFAPGVDVYSTMPFNKYEAMSGTSMASPVVCGVAALLRSYHPELSAVETKEILLKSAVVYKKKVTKPGTKDKVKLADLSKTGAIINAYEALKLADTYKK